MPRKRARSLSPYEVLLPTRVPRRDVIADLIAAPIIDLCSPTQVHTPVSRFTVKSPVFGGQTEVVEPDLSCLFVPYHGPNLGLDDDCDIDMEKTDIIIEACEKMQADAESMAPAVAYKSSGCLASMKRFRLHNDADNFHKSFMEFERCIRSIPDFF